MLGSNHPGERENAGVMIEKQRAAMGLVWDELIIAADEVGARAA
jgi:hypothetical protein